MVYRLSESTLREIIIEAVEDAMREARKKSARRERVGEFDEYMKAIRKGSREAELERNVGWVAKDRPHKNKKKYDRKAEKRDLRAAL